MEIKEVNRLRGMAVAQGFSFVWDNDWSVNHQKEFDCYDDGGPDTCESCVMVDENGTVLASLCCIDDATSEYRRVVEAELASEVLEPVFLRTKRLRASRRNASADESNQFT